MNNFYETKKSLIKAIYNYNLNEVHTTLVEFIDQFSCLEATEQIKNLRAIELVYEAYKNNDFLRLADLLEFDIK